jgi:hypothetical protein
MVIKLRFLPTSPESGQARRQRTFFILGIKRTGNHSRREGAGMAKKSFTKGNTGQLKPAARAFLEAYQAACAKSDEDFRRVVSGDRGYRSFEGGLLELTDELAKANDDLVETAVKLFGPSGASERSLSLLAEQVGQGVATGEYDIDEGVTKLIDIFIDEGNSSFEVILPNYLVRFKTAFGRSRWDASKRPLLLRYHFTRFSCKRDKRDKPGQMSQMSRVWSGTNGTHPL